MGYLDKSKALKSDARVKVTGKPEPTFPDSILDELQRYLSPGTASDHGRFELTWSTPEDGQWLLIVCEDGCQAWARKDALEGDLWGLEWRIHEHTAPVGADGIRRRYLVRTRQDGLAGEIVRSDHGKKAAGSKPAEPHLMVQPEGPIRQPRLIPFD